MSGPFTSALDPAMRNVISFAARLLGSPTLRRTFHTAGVLLIACAQLLGIWS